MNRHRVLQRLAWLAALTLCFGQVAADTHLHLDEIEEEVCTLCGFSDPGDILNVGATEGQPLAWYRNDSVPVFVTPRSPRPFETSHARAPPVS